MAGIAGLLGALASHGNPSGGGSGPFFVNMPGGGSMIGGMPGGGGMMGGMSGGGSMIGVMPEEEGGTVMVPYGMPGDMRRRCGEMRSMQESGKGYLLQQQPWYDMMMEKCQSIEGQDRRPTDVGLGQCRVSF